MPSKANRPYVVMRTRTLQGSLPIIKHLSIGLLICVIGAQSLFADTITYPQLRQEPSSRPRTVTTSPTVARTDGQNPQGRTSQPSGGSEAPVAAESPNHPEFVRLPDGRIVRYGPGVLCDENCVEPVTPAAFREPGPRWWWIAPPLIAGGVLCAFLCRPGGDSEAQPTPTIIIPPSPISSPTPGSTASPAPSSQPPEQIPEPGTMMLVGSGLAAFLLRKRMKIKRNQE